MVKLLIMLYPLICIIIAIQAYETYFGPSNEFDGTRRMNNSPRFGALEKLQQFMGNILPG
jgi:hypothetical protein